MGTLGSGNHYLEVQKIAEIFDPTSASVFGLRSGEVVVTIHCGSRGLGHQIGTDYLREMITSPSRQPLEIPDRELAAAPIDSPMGRRYLGAMRAGINCALANRQILTHRVRRIFAHHFQATHLRVLYDVSHNTCKVETHQVDGRSRPLHVHRKGATRAWGPGHPELPQDLQPAGQPVLIGGSMGTGSYILVGTNESEDEAFSSAVHGAGRALSRTQANRQWRGREVMEELSQRGILIRSPSLRGIAEEAPGAYKDVGTVVDAAEKAHLARKVARLEPLICIKG